MLKFDLFGGRGGRGIRRHVYFVLMGLVVWLCGCMMWYGL